MSSMNTSEVAKHLGTTPRVVRRFCTSGQLKATQDIRGWWITLADLMAFVREHPPRKRRWDADTGISHR